MNLQPMSLKDSLYGNVPFYNQPDYLKKTTADFGSEELLPVSYPLPSNKINSTNIEWKIVQLAKMILSAFVWVYKQFRGLCRWIPALVGILGVLPAAAPWLHEFPDNYAEGLRKTVFLGSEWKYKRFTVEVDGYKIDAAIMGTASNLKNRRWTLISNGNGQWYEEKLGDIQIRTILTHVNSNAIIFNYPGVGLSSGLPNKAAMVKAYHAILELLEDQKEGIGAKEIIGLGHSIGGGVQGTALQDYSLRKDIKYVFVKSRTFGKLSQLAACLVARPTSPIIKLTGWEMDSIKSSKKLQAPEIILQTANVRSYEILADSSKIISDGLISAKASLAKQLLDDPTCPKHQKLFIGIPEGHNEGYWAPRFLAARINEILELQAKS